MAITNTERHVDSMGNVYSNNTSKWGTLNSTSLNNTMIAPQKVVIPDGVDVVMGDFTMTAAEFKVCMKVLRKLAMEECPEEFI